MSIISFSNTGKDKPCLIKKLQLVRVNAADIAKKILAIVYSSGVNFSYLKVDIRFHVHGPPESLFWTARPIAEVDVPEGMVQLVFIASRILL